MICLPQTHRVKKSRLGSAAPPNRPELPLLSEGGFSAFFWPGAAKKAHKQIDGGKKEKKKKLCKSDFQEFGNRPTSSEMNKKWKAQIVSYEKRHILVNCTLA